MTGTFLSQTRKLTFISQNGRTIEGSFQQDGSSDFLCFIFHRIDLWLFVDLNGFKSFLRVSHKILPLLFNKSGQNLEFFIQQAPSITP